MVGLPDREEAEGSAPPTFRPGLHPRVSVLKDTQLAGGEPRVSGRPGSSRPTAHLTAGDCRTEEAGVIGAGHTVRGAKNHGTRSCFNHCALVRSGRTGWQGNRSCENRSSGGSRGPGCGMVLGPWGRRSTQARHSGARCALVCTLTQRKCFIALPPQFPHL